MRALWITIVFFFFGLLVHAQDIGNPPCVRFADTQIGDTFFQMSSPLCGSLDSVKHQLNSRLDSLRHIGYLTAHLDTLYLQEDYWHTEVFIGKYYILNQIQPSDTTSLHLDENEISQIRQANTPNQVKSITQDLLLKKGYTQNKIIITPAFLPSNHPDTQYYELQLNIDAGPQTQFGKILIKSDTLAHIAFLQKHLFWKRGHTFNVNTYRNIERRIRDLPYLKLASPPEIAMEYNQAHVTLELEKEPANIFDFIIGVLPAHDVQDRNLIFSVYLNTVLHNLLKNGEKIEIKFINTKPETQELNLGFQYPYILNSPVGTFGSFQLFRDEETHIDLRYKLGLSLPTEKGIQWNISYDRFSSNLLNPDTSFLLREKKLPDELDFTTNRFGVSAIYNHVDYLFAPRKGFTSEIGFSFGQKIINKNNTLLNFQEQGIEVSPLYDSLQLEQNQFEFQYDVRGYWPVSRRWTLAGFIRGQHLIGSGELVQNELYRIGGSQNLRGFDEQFFSVNQYVLTTLEMRFFLDRRSFFSAFSDLAYLDRSSLERNFSGWVNSIGLGIHFQTTVGLFQLNYAIGSDLELPFDISAGKIHFGYVSLF